MQLSDAEIREILIREKIKKRKKQRMRKRIALLIAVILVIALVVAIIVHIRDKTEEVSYRGTIFIDPGHGGSDPGSDDGGRYEKDDTLTLGLAVRDALQKESFKVEMSRTEDDYVDRTQRGEMANECGAQLMVCIHRNKSQGQGDGVEVFIPLSNTEECQLLGGNIMKALVAQGFTERTVRAGTLASPDEDYEENAAAKMPCCLVEVGFISDEGDNKLFDTKLEENASAIAGAIGDTFAELYESVPDEEL